MQTAATTLIDKSALERELLSLRRREGELCEALNGKPPAIMQVVVPYVCVITYKQT